MPPRFSSNRKQAAKPFVVLTNADQPNYVTVTTKDISAAEADDYLEWTVQGAEATAEMPSVPGVDDDAAKDLKAQGYQVDDQREEAPYEDYPNAADDDDFVTGAKTEARDLQQMWFSNTAGVTKTAGYREPADLPIDVAMIDPIDGELFFGDDKPDDELRTHLNRPSTRRDGLSDIIPTYSKDNPGKDNNKKKKANQWKQADMSKSQLDSEASNLMKTDPRFKDVGSEVFKRFLARMQVGFSAGLPAGNVMSMFYRGAPFSSLQVFAQPGFNHLETYVENAETHPGAAPSAPSNVLQFPGAGEWGAEKTNPGKPAPDLSQADPSAQLADLLGQGKQPAAPAGDPVNAAIKAWGEAKANFEAIKSQFDSAKGTMDLALKAVGAVADDLGKAEGKTADIDAIIGDIKFEYRRYKDKSNPSYAKAIEEVRPLLAKYDGLLQALEEAISKNTSHSRYETIKTKPAPKAGRLISVAAEQGGVELSFLTKQMNRVLDQILGILENAVGSEQEYRKAAARYTREPSDWLDGFFAQADTAPVSGFKDGDQVTDKEGNAGTVKVNPAGGMDVEWSGGGKATYDQDAVDKGMVARAVKHANVTGLAGWLR